MRTATSRASARSTRRATALVASPAVADTADEDVSSTDRVVNHITAGVLAGRYVPGQRLVESDLTRALRVSRGPVREAFRRLDALGILSRTMHRGACVRTLSRAEAVDLMIAIEGIDILTSRLAATAVKNRTGGRPLVAFERALRPYRDGEYDLAAMPQSAAAVLRPADRHYRQQPAALAVSDDAHPPAAAADPVVPQLRCTKHGRR